MSKMFKSHAERLMALIVAVLLLINLVPVTAFFSMATGEPFYVKVVNFDSNDPVVGATVTLTPADGTDIASPLVADTGADGKATFPAIGDYFDEAKPAFTVTYTVSKDGFEEVSVTDPVSVTSESAGLPDVMITPIDTTLPTISSVTGIPDDPTAADYWKTSIIVTVVAADNEGGRGLADKAYKIEGIADWKSENNFTISANGTYKAFARDKSGNVSDAFEFTVGCIDNDAPVFAVTIDPDSWFNSSSEVKMVINASDDGCGLHDTAYGMDINDINDESQWHTQGTDENDYFKVNDGETHTFFVRDKLGNFDTKTIRATKFDDVPPTIDGVARENENWSQTNVTYIVTATDHVKDYFSGNIVDGGSGVAKYGVVLTSEKDDPSKITWHDAKEENANKFEINTRNNYTFFVEDAAGNRNEWSMSDADLPKIDTQKPTITGVTLLTDEWTNQSVTFIVTAKDDPIDDDAINAQSGIAEYAMDDPTNEENWQPENTFEVSDNNEHTFYVKDHAGNVSEVTDVCKKSATNFEVEKPQITGVTINKTVNDSLVPLEDNEWTNQPVTFVVSAEDVPDSNNIVSGIAAYRVDDGEWQYNTDTEEKNTFILSDHKEHTFYVRDNAGNVSEVTDDCKKAAPQYDARNPELVDPDGDGDAKSITFSCDHTDVGSLILNFLTFGQFFNKKEVVTVYANDVADDETTGDISSASGIATYTLHFDAPGDDNDYSTPEQPLNVFTFDAEKIENFKGTVYVEIKDYAGNTTGRIQATTENSNLQETTFMIENDKPVIKVENVPTAIVIGNETDNETDKKYIINQNFNVSFNVSDIPENNAKERSGINYVEVKVNNISVFIKNFAKEGTQTDLFPASGDCALTVDLAKKTINGVPLSADEWNNGKLELKFYAVDNSGNVADKVSKTYYVDETAPVISGFAFEVEQDPGNAHIDVQGEGEIPVYRAVEVTDYGFYFKEAVTVTVYADDLVGENETMASGTASITYFKQCLNEKTGEMVNEEINTVPVDGEGKISFEIGKDFKGQIYAFATDRLGNKPCKKDADGVETDTYVHPNGSVLETEEHHNSEKGHVVMTLPKAPYTQNDKTPLYNGSVKFAVNVTDLYAGIRTVEWEVKSPCDTDRNFSDSLIIENDGTIKDKNGAERTDWTVGSRDQNLVTQISKSITVANNSNDIVVTVRMTDRAGNESSQQVKFGIDTTKPTISVKYDNNSPDAKYTDFYKANRTATITITERNFRAENVEYLITNTDGVIPHVDLTKDANWKKIESKVNGTDTDKTQYETKITYSADGDYTFKINFKDNANNKAAEYNDKFTIDKTIPTVTVVYDNNSAQNGNYYKADRTATITFKEHNFDPARVKIIGTASEAAFPALSGWTHSGDLHTAKLSYNIDSKYTFDIEFADKAGNSIADFAKQEFTVDKTNPALSISGISDESANSGNDNIGFVVTATDTNFDVFQPVITAVRYSKGNFETSRINPGSFRNIGSGMQYVVTNIDTDGIYRITCTVVDKAGNAFSQVLLEDANGKTYSKDRSGDDVLLTFSVNRKGSVFTIDEKTQKVLDQFYVRDIADSILIHEINADTITDRTVSVNDKELTEGKDYTVSLDKGEGTWYRYTYNIKTSVFENEGEYNIVISTKDKAKNQAFSDIKNVSVKFVVDRTAPIITLAGLKSNGRYRTEEQTVTIVPSDDGGYLKKLIVRTVDAEGKVLEELLNLEGDELQDAIAAGHITFRIKEGLYQNIQVICEDIAGNITGDSTTGEIFKNVSVSTNAFLIFWANQPIRWTVIGGIVVIIAAACAFVIFKKRKIAPVK